MDSVQTVWRCTHRPSNTSTAQERSLQIQASVSTCYVLTITVLILTWITQWPSPVVPLWAVFSVWPKLISPYSTSPSNTHYCSRTKVMVPLPVTQMDSVKWDVTYCWNVSIPTIRINVHTSPHITKWVGGGGITGLQRQLQLIRNVRGLSQESRQGNHTIYGNRSRI